VPIAELFSPTISRLPRAQALPGSCRGRPLDGHDIAGYEGADGA
jgi:hypothetical protein